MSKPPKSQPTIRKKPISSLFGSYLSFEGFIGPVKNQMKARPDGSGYFQFARPVSIISRV
jgi:hypothetical protein